jgi:hypothetical protein
MLAEKKKQNQTLNTQELTTHIHIQSWKYKRKKNCLLEPRLLGYEDYIEQLLTSMQTTRWWQQQPKK